MAVAIPTVDPQLRRAVVEGAGVAVAMELPLEGVVTAIVVAVAEVMVEEEVAGGHLHDVNVSEEGGVALQLVAVVAADSSKNLPRRRSKS
jgi:hypothetical protein